MHTDTNTFFKNLVELYTKPGVYDIKIEWKESANEDHQTRQWVKVGQNLISLLSRIFYYHFERGRKTHPAAEKAKEYLVVISEYVFRKLEHLAGSSAQDLRNGFLNQVVEVFFVVMALARTCTHFAIRLKISSF